MSDYYVYLSLVCVLSVILCMFLSTSIPGGDFCYHFNWMRIAHRFPIYKWYSPGSNFALDYPPLQGYIHYLMGILYNLIDPNAIYETDIFMATPVSPLRQYSLRIVILFLTVVLYYPAVICCVHYICRRHSDPIKLLLIAILFNFPLFVQLEHFSLQVNSPTLTFLLYSIFFMFKRYYSLTAIFFGLSITAKQITLPCIVPISFYIILNLRKEAEEKRRPILFFIFQCIKLLLIGFSTLLLILSPFLLHSESLIEMKNNIFPAQSRQWIGTASNLCRVFRYWLNPYDIYEYRLFIFKSCVALILAICFLTLPFMWKRPRSKKLFWAIFTICTLSTYFFGFHIHEQHLQYACIGFMFNFIYFKRLLCPFSLCVSYGLLTLIPGSHTIPYYFVLNLTFLLIVYIFYQYIPEIPSKQNTNCILKIYNFHINNSSRFSIIVIATIVFLFIFKNIWIFYNPTSFYQFNDMISFHLAPTFLFLIIIFIFMWTDLYVMAYHHQKSITCQFLIFYFTIRLYVKNFNQNKQR